MSTGGNAAQSLTEKVKGAANLAHGSGETIRGNINSFVDNLGNQVQNQSGSSGTHSGLGDSTSGTGIGMIGSATGGSSRDVENDVKNHTTAEQGKGEMQAGLEALQRK